MLQQSTTTTDVRQHTKSDTSSAVGRAAAATPQRSKQQYEHTGNRTRQHDTTLTRPHSIIVDTCPAALSTHVWWWEVRIRSNGATHTRLPLPHVAGVVRTGRQTHEGGNTYTHSEPKTCRQRSERQSRSIKDPHKQRMKGQRHRKKSSKAAPVPTVKTLLHLFEADGSGDVYMSIHPAKRQ